MAGRKKVVSEQNEEANLANTSLQQVENEETEVKEATQINEESSLNGESNKSYDDSSIGRVARLARKTAETDIRVEFNLDGSGRSKINTGVGFFDHMLTSFTKHGLFDLDLVCNGDLYVDTHHTIEDIGIVLGVAIREAVGNKKGIKRFGSVILPMDDALVLCSLDLSGRPYLAFNADFSTEKVGYMDTCMVREFFYAISYSAGMNLHIKMLDGHNDHHIIEGMFKAFAKALDSATMYDPRITDVLSTKGSL